MARARGESRAAYMQATQSYSRIRVILLADSCFIGQLCAEMSSHWTVVIFGEPSQWTVPC